MAKVETYEEIIEFLKLFNPTDKEFKEIIGDPDTVELAVAIGDQVQPKDINTGAVVNTLEFERRLARFLIKMMDMSQAQGEYLDIVARDNTGNVRPEGFSDIEYYNFVVSKLIDQKETVLAIIELLQPFSSEPVQIFEPGSNTTGMFAGMSFSDYFTIGVRDGTIDEPVGPSLLGGSFLDNTAIYYFRVKLQPTDIVAAKIISKLLRSAHVSGVGFDIELFNAIP